MANIDNPQARRIANEIVRPMADIISQMFRASDQFMLDIIDFEAAVAGAANADVLLDGSEIDGRTPLTKENVAEIKYVVEQLRLHWASDAYKAQVIGRAAVNTRPPF